MKISREWLQTYFDKELPSADELAHALTFHAFEIESVENEIMDVKVTPNRGHDCLSYRGIAKEVSAISGQPMNAAALEGTAGPMQQFTFTLPLTVKVAEPDLCKRYIAWSIKGVKVGPSPKWLSDRLVAMGQQSINNVVDATNYVMFNTGQPLHAFDAGALQVGKDGHAIEVRKAKEGEKLMALDTKEYILKDSMLVIADANAGVAIGIAGVKGGQPAGITEATTDIIIESANFDGVSVRRTAQALKLRTDASQRFEQVLAPELSALGMRAAATLILQLAQGELAGFADVYPHVQEKRSVSVSLEKINRVLGTECTAKNVEDVFTRLGFTHTSAKGVFTVEVPFERLDLEIPEDLVEEVGRIIGYDKVSSTKLPDIKEKPEVNENFAWAEKTREELLDKGYSEVLTSVFADKGERAVANKVDGARPYLRTTLVDGLKDALERNSRNKELLGVDAVRIFEIGTVWKDSKEVMMLGTADENGITEKLLEPVAAKKYAEVVVSGTEQYKPFSRYPYIVRDIALWVPEGTKSEKVLEVITEHAGDLVVRSAKFDEFKKGEKVSYAFRLVFQSMDRTLFDGDANERMESVYMAVKEKGWEVR